MKIYWFKAKLFGWGWVPAAWQGWLVMVLFILAIVGSAFVCLRPPLGLERWMAWLASIAVALSVLLVLCFKFGEKPRWR